MYNQGIRETQNVRIASESVIEEYWRKYEDTLYKFNTDTRRLKSELMKRRRLGESNAQMYHAQQQRVERDLLNNLPPLLYLLKNPPPPLFFLEKGGGGRLLSTSVER